MPATFHERLDRLAQAKGVSTSKLGTQAGLSPDTVNQWIRKSKAGKLPGRAEEHGKLAAFWGVDAEWLLGRTDRGGPRELGYIAGAHGVPSDEMREAVYVTLVKDDVRPRRAEAAVAAAAAYEQTLQHLPTSIERMTQLAYGILGADAPTGSVSSPPSSSRPVGAATRHKIRRALAK